MRKWCPEPLDTTREESRSQDMNIRHFAAESSFLEGSPETPVEDGPVFEQDLGLTGGRSLWNLMNQEERDRLQEEVKATLQEEFALKEKELRRRQHEAIEALHSEWSQRLDNWSRELSAQLALEKQERAVEATGLAVALASKIIRDQVEVDRALLIRTLETALFKVGDTRLLTVTLHPEDEQFLKDNPEMMERLRIKEVVPDRRVAKGGCRIRAGVREWDATLEGQLKALAEVLAETLAEAEAGPRRSEGSGDPGVD